MILYTIEALIIGYLADLIFGDPHGMWHPICFIGTMIAKFEKGLRRIFPETERGERCGGICLVLAVLFCASAIPFLLLFFCYKIHWILGFVLQCYMCYTILATKSLKTESMKVYTALEENGVEAGRHAVSMIVGRDTQSLDAPGVIRATVETVAENASDGVTAPMLYMIIGGPVLGYFYKAVNTMDSMVGYKNEKYLYFGRAAAKLDDVMNFIPSRLCALFLIAACCFTGQDGREARRIFRRDRYNHASPNSAQTESVMAGALRVQLAGDAWYFGKKHEKPTIGDAHRPVEAEDIIRADRMLYAASALGMAVFCAVRLAIEISISIL